MKLDNLLILILLLLQSHLFQLGWPDFWDSSISFEFYEILYSAYKIIL
jgi:hypothetical protein